jgi:hypothetical protein
LPSQVEGNTRSTALSQLAALQTVPAGWRRHAPEPLQVPSKPQVSAG